MSRGPGGRERQVNLTTYDNEPMARLAEQRLRQEGVPCLIRTRHGGPGLWGSAYNLPHALYVFESHEMLAREILDLVPLEVVERGPARSDTQVSSPGPLLTLVVIVILLVIIMGAASFSRLLG